MGAEGWLKHKKSKLEFGTELVVAEDKVARGAAGRFARGLDSRVHRDQGAAKCFGNELTEGAWLPRLKAIIPTYRGSISRSMRRPACAPLPKPHRCSSPTTSQQLPDPRGVRKLARRILPIGSFTRQSQEDIHGRDEKRDR